VRPTPLRLIAPAMIPLLLALAFAGCGGSHSTAPIVKAPHLPVGTPGNTAPDSTVLRWVAAYAATAEPEYDSLLASDFHYRFSPQTDPALVTQYGNNWGKVDESTSYHHALHGFSNSSGTYVPPFVNVTGNAQGLSMNADPDHADSTSWYQLVEVVQLSFDIDVSDPGGTTTYDVRAGFTFHLVRGDAAVLSPGQDHSATRWYIRQCDDLSTAIALVKRSPATEMPLPANTRTWGSVRNQYHS